jgi:hypothetical protein
MNDCPRQNPAYRPTPTYVKAPVKRGFLSTPRLLTVWCYKNATILITLDIFPPLICIVLGRQEPCKSLCTSNTNKLTTTIKTAIL